MKPTEEFRISNSTDLDPLIAAVGDARIVLLGEASHGTHDYYVWRTAISKRLIQEKGFGFIAVEGDWPDCYRVNRFVKCYDGEEGNPDDVLRRFNRWPTWMWANWEVAALITWLRDHNVSRPANRRVGFYGLDVYSLWESMETLIGYLKKHDPPAARIAQRAMDCFSASGHDEQAYAYHSLSESCRKEVTRLLTEIRTRASSYDHDPEASLNTTQNAYVAVEAEKYYSNMVAFDDNTWNIRDRHMMDTLTRLLEFHGPRSKAIVWEHNTHVGDARFTDMARGGNFNIGQLARQQYPGQGTFIVGFGSYAGAVIAGSAWGDPMREMAVPAAITGSIERHLHDASTHNRCLLFRDRQNAEYDKTWPHRAIGVVYNPKAERYNYVPSVVARRYDAFVYIDQSSALHPIHVTPDKRQVPETYPFSF